jgi:hypothetical protein
MKRPYFTFEQEEWICYALDQWYLDNKGEFQNTPFGFKKEILKEILCGVRRNENF